MVITALVGATVTCCVLWVRGTKHVEPVVPTIAPVNKTLAVVAAILLLVWIVRFAWVVSLLFLFCAMGAKVSRRRIGVIAGDR